MQASQLFRMVPIRWAVLKLPVPNQAEPMVWAFGIGCNSTMPEVALLVLSAMGLPSAKYQGEIQDAPANALCCGMYSGNNPITSTEFTLLVGLVEDPACLTQWWQTLGVTNYRYIAGCTIYAQ